MKPIFLVTNDETDAAKKIEKKLISLSPASGVLFVGVRVSPKDDLRTYPVYVITIGCAHNIDPRTMTPLVYNVLKDEIAAGMQVAITALNGVGRK
jgi:hypothetical protein